MQPTTVLGGPAEVAMNGMTIPASLLSEVAAEFTEGTRERESLGGTFTRPSGVLETAEVTFTLFLPSMDYLKNIFPGRYNAPTNAVAQKTGNVVFDSSKCTTTNTGPTNIHYICENNDNNDIFIPAGLAAFNINPEYNSDDPLTVEITIYAQPDANGVVARLGTGNLATNSVYQASTGTTTPYVS